MDGLCPGWQRQHGAPAAARCRALLLPVGRMLVTDPRTFGANLSDKF